MADGDREPQQPSFFRCDLGSISDASSRATGALLHTLGSAVHVRDASPLSCSVFYPPTGGIEFHRGPITHTLLSSLLETGSGRPSSVVNLTSSSSTPQTGTSPALSLSSPPTQTTGVAQYLPVRYPRASFPGTQQEVSFPEYRPCFASQQRPDGRLEEGTPQSDTRGSPWSCDSSGQAETHGMRPVASSTWPGSLSIFSGSRSPHGPSAVSSLPADYERGSGGDVTLIFRNQRSESLSQVGTSHHPSSTFASSCMPVFSPDNDAGRCGDGRGAPLIGDSGQLRRSGEGESMYMERCSGGLADGRDISFQPRLSSVWGGGSTQVLGRDHSLLPDQDCSSWSVTGDTLSPNTAPSCLATSARDYGQTCVSREKPIVEALPIPAMSSHSASGGATSPTNLAGSCQSQVPVVFQCVCPSDSSAWSSCCRYCLTCVECKEQLVFEEASGAVFLRQYLECRSILEQLASPQNDTREVAEGLFGRAVAKPGVLLAFTAFAVSGHSERGFVLACIHAQHHAYVHGTGDPHKEETVHRVRNETDLAHLVKACGAGKGDHTADPRWRPDKVNLSPASTRPTEEQLQTGSLGSSTGEQERSRERSQSCLSPSCRRRSQQAAHGPSSEEALPAKHYVEDIRSGAKQEIPATSKLSSDCCDCLLRDGARRPRRKELKLSRRRQKLHGSTACHTGCRTHTHRRSVVCCRGHATLACCASPPWASPLGLVTVMNCASSSSVPSSPCASLVLCAGNEAVQSSRLERKDSSSSSTALQILCASLLLHQVIQPHWKAYSFFERSASSYLLLHASPTHASDRLRPHLHRLVAAVMLLRVPQFSSASPSVSRSKCRGGLGGNTGCQTAGEFRNRTDTPSSHQSIGSQLPPREQQETDEIRTVERVERRDLCQGPSQRGTEREGPARVRAGLVDNLALNVVLTEGTTQNDVGETKSVASQLHREESHGRGEMEFSHYGTNRGDIVGGMDTEDDADAAASGGHSADDREDRRGEEVKENQREWRSGPSEMRARPTNESERETLPIGDEGQGVENRHDDTSPEQECGWKQLELLLMTLLRLTSEPCGTLPGFRAPSVSARQRAQLAILSLCRCLVEEAFAAVAPAPPTRRACTAFTCGGGGSEQPIELYQERIEDCSLVELLIPFLMELLNRQQPAPSTCFGLVFAGLTAGASSSSSLSVVGTGDLAAASVALTRGRLKHQLSLGFPALAHACVELYRAILQAAADPWRLVPKRSYSSFHEQYPLLTAGLHPDTHRTASRNDPPAHTDKECSKTVSPSRGNSNTDLESSIRGSSWMRPRGRTDSNARYSALRRRWLLFLHCVGSSLSDFAETLSTLLRCCSCHLNDAAHLNVSVACVACLSEVHRLVNLCFSVSRALRCHSSDYSFVLTLPCKCCDLPRQRRRGRLKGRKMEVGGGPGCRRPWVASGRIPSDRLEEATEGVGRERPSDERDSSPRAAVTGAGDRTTELSGGASSTECPPSTPHSCVSVVPASAPDNREGLRRDKQRPAGEKLMPTFSSLRGSRSPSDQEDEIGKKKQVVDSNQVERNIESAEEQLTGEGGVMRDAGYASPKQDPAYSHKGGGDDWKSGRATLYSSPYPSDGQSAGRVLDTHLRSAPARSRSSSVSVPINSSSSGRRTGPCLVFCQSCARSFHIRYRAAYAATARVAKFDGRGRQLARAATEGCLELLGRYFRMFDTLLLGEDEDGAGGFFFDNAVASGPTGGATVETGSTLVVQVIRLLAVLAQSPHASTVFFSPCQSAASLPFQCSLSSPAPTECISPVFLSLVFSLVLPYCQIPPSEEHGLLQNQTVITSFADYPSLHLGAKELRKARTVYGFLEPNCLRAIGRSCLRSLTTPGSFFHRGLTREHNSMSGCCELGEPLAKVSVHKHTVACCRRASKRQGTSCQQRISSGQEVHSPATCPATDRVGAQEERSFATSSSFVGADEKHHVLKQHVGSGTRRQEEFSQSSVVLCSDAPHSCFRTKDNCRLRCAACDRRIRSAKCFALRSRGNLSPQVYSSLSSCYSPCDSGEDGTGQEATSGRDQPDEFFTRRGSLNAGERKAAGAKAGGLAGHAYSGAATCSACSSSCACSPSAHREFHSCVSGKGGCVDGFHLHGSRGTHLRHPSPADARFMNATKESSSADGSGTQSSYGGNPDSNNGLTRAATSHTSAEMGPSTSDSERNRSISRHGSPEGGGCRCLCSVLARGGGDSRVARRHCERNCLLDAEDIEGPVMEQDKGERCQDDSTEGDEDEQTEEDSIRMAALQLLRTLESRGGNELGCWCCEQSCCAFVSRGTLDMKPRRRRERRGTGVCSVEQNGDSSSFSTSCGSCSVSVSWSSSTSEENSSDDSLHTANAEEESFAAGPISGGMSFSSCPQRRQLWKFRPPDELTWEADSGTDSSSDCDYDCEHHTRLQTLQVHANGFHHRRFLHQENGHLPYGAGALATAAAVVEAAGSVIQLGEARKREGSRGWWRLTEVGLWALGAVARYLDDLLEVNAERQEQLVQSSGEPFGSLVFSYQGGSSSRPHTHSSSGLPSHHLHCGSRSLASWQKSRHRKVNVNSAAPQAIAKRISLPGTWSVSAARAVDGIVKVLAAIVTASPNGKRDGETAQKERGTNEDEREVRRGLSSVVDKVRGGEQDTKVETPGCGPVTVDGREEHKGEEKETRERLKAEEEKMAPLLRARALLVAKALSSYLRRRYGKEEVQALARLALQNCGDASQHTVVRLFSFFTFECFLPHLEPASVDARATLCAEVLNSASSLLPSLLPVPAFSLFRLLLRFLRHTPELLVRTSPERIQLLLVRAWRRASRAPQLNAVFQELFRRCLGGGCRHRLMTAMPTISLAIQEHFGPLSLTLLKKHRAALDARKTFISSDTSGVPGETSRVFTTPLSPYVSCMCVEVLTTLFFTSASPSVVPSGSHVRLVGSTTGTGGQAFRSSLLDEKSRAGGTEEEGNEKKGVEEGGCAGENSPWSHNAPRDGLPCKTGGVEKTEEVVATSGSSPSSLADCTQLARVNESEAAEVPVLEVLWDAVQEACALLMMTDDDELLRLGSECVAVFLLRTHPPVSTQSSRRLLASDFPFATPLECGQSSAEQTEQQRQAAGGAEESVSHLHQLREVERNAPRNGVFGASQCLFGKPMQLFGTSPALQHKRRMTEALLFPCLLPVAGRLLNDWGLGEAAVNHLAGLWEVIVFCFFKESPLLQPQHLQELLLLLVRRQAAARMRKQHALRLELLVVCCWLVLVDPENLIQFLATTPAVHKPSLVDETPTESSADSCVHLQPGVGEQGDTFEAGQRTPRGRREPSDAAKCDVSLGRSDEQQQQQPTEQAHQGGSAVSSDVSVSPWSQDGGDLEVARAQEPENTDGDQALAACVCRTPSEKCPRDDGAVSGSASGTEQGRADFGLRMTDQRARGTDEGLRGNENDEVKDWSSKRYPSSLLLCVLRELIRVLRRIRSKEERKGKTMGHGGKSTPLLGRCGTWLQEHEECCGTQTVEGTRFFSTDYRSLHAALFTRQYMRKVLIAFTCSILGWCDGDFLTSVSCQALPFPNSERPHRGWNASVEETGEKETRCSLSRAKGVARPPVAKFGVAAELIIQLLRIVIPLKKLARAAVLADRVRFAKASRQVRRPEPSVLSSNRPRSSSGNELLGGRSGWHEGVRHFSTCVDPDVCWSSAGMAVSRCSSASVDSLGSAEVRQMHSRFVSESNGVLVDTAGVCNTGGKRGEAPETAQRRSLGVRKERGRDGTALPDYSCGEEQSRVLRRCGSSAALPQRDTEEEKRDARSQELVKESTVDGPRFPTQGSFQEGSFHLNAPGRGLAVREDLPDYGIFQSSASESNLSQRLLPQRLSQHTWSSAEGEAAPLPSRDGSRRSSVHAAAAGLSGNEGEPSGICRVPVTQRSSRQSPVPGQLSYETQSNSTLIWERSGDCPAVSLGQRRPPCPESPEPDREGKQCCPGSHSGCLSPRQCACSLAAWRRAREETEATPHEPPLSAVGDRKKGSSADQVWKERAAFQCSCCPCFFAAAASGRCAVSSVSAFVLEEIMRATSHPSESREEQFKICPKCYPREDLHEYRDRAAQAGSRVNDTSDYECPDQEVDSSGAEREVFSRLGAASSREARQKPKGKFGGSVFDVFTERRARDPLATVPENVHVVALLRHLVCKTRLKDGARAWSSEPLWWSILDSRLRDLIFRLLAIEIAQPQVSTSGDPRGLGCALQSRSAALECDWRSHWRSEVLRGSTDHNRASPDASHLGVASGSLQGEMPTFLRGSATTADVYGHLASVPCLRHYTACPWCDACGAGSPAGCRSASTCCEEVKSFCIIYLLAEREVTCSKLDEVPSFPVSARKGYGSAANERCFRRTHEASRSVVHRPGRGFTGDGFGPTDSSGLLGDGREDGAEREETSERQEAFDTQKEEPEREKKNANDDADGEMTCD
ncbi:hypothetical protein CSUI_002742 [Cystoisospora suis]|uniref:Uncharacterized protein n=1 Tax=Cystoisospora suis TaxID=483139 RepID=A0A2C6L821_9APIC|nr:hypothetical protein CSUI_002742 [Cystoisospora suis]